MSDKGSVDRANEQPRSEAWKAAAKTLQDAKSPHIPESASAMTFWEPGGDVIHVGGLEQHERD